VHSPLPTNVTPSASQKSKLSHKAKQQVFSPPNFLIEASHRGHTAHPDPSRRRRNHKTVPALDSRLAQCGTPTLRPRRRATLFLGFEEACSLTLWVFSCCSFAFCFFSRCAKASLEIHIKDSLTEVMTSLQYQHRLPEMLIFQPVSWMRAARPLLEKREREQALVRFVLRFERSEVSPCVT
jgi:hypothetical protein